VGHSHAHDGEVDFWAEFGALMASPAHWLFELVTSVVFYLIFGLLFYRFIIVQLVMPRVNRKISALHEELDAEHGIEHVDDKVYRVDGDDDTDDNGMTHTSSIERW
jgi:hypothetical protein